jgi:hypothetical protein
VHLLTQQAFALYLQHIKPDGILAVHASNRILVNEADEPIQLWTDDYSNLFQILR